MKKTALICLILLMSSCYHYTAFKKTVYVDDFRQYIEEGFIISPSAAGFTYKPIAEVFVEVVAGTGKQYAHKDLMSELVSKAKELGANAVLNYSSENYYDSNLASVVYKTRGFAVIVE